jgi:hypothetical protein
MKSTKELKHHSTVGTYAPPEATVVAETDALDCAGAAGAGAAEVAGGAADVVEAAGVLSGTKSANAPTFDLSSTNTRIGCNSPTGRGEIKAKHINQPFCTCNCKCG